MVIVPADSGSSPSSTFSSVLLPAPLGPRMARHVPGATSRSSFSQITCWPYRTVAPRNAIADPPRPFMSLSPQRVQSGFGLGELPGLVAAVRRWQGLGDPHHRDARLAGQGLHMLGHRAHHLGVVEQHLYLVTGEQAVHQ